MSEINENNANGDRNISLAGKDNTISLENINTEKVNYKKEMSKISSLEQQLKNKNLQCWIFWAWIIAIVSLGISITVFFMKWNANNASLSIVLGFVGILATFVVISNYVQVKEIKDKFDSYQQRMQSIQYDVINLQVGLCMTNAESFTASNPISSIYYYLKAIELGLEFGDETENIHKCINEISKFDNYESVINGKDFIIKVNEEKFPEMINKIKNSENYKLIKFDFERILKKTN